VWLIRAVVCLHAASRTMPISCRFRDCKALQVTSLTHVSSAIASAEPFTASADAAVDFVSAAKFFGIRLKTTQISRQRQ